MAPLRAVIPVLLALQVALGVLAGGRTICIGDCSPIGVELVAESCGVASNCCGSDEADLRAGDETAPDAAGHAEHGHCAASGECGDCRDIEISMELFRPESRRGSDDVSLGIDAEVPGLLAANVGHCTNVAHAGRGLEWRTGPPRRAPELSTVILRL